MCSGNFFCLFSRLLLFNFCRDLVCKAQLLHSYQSGVLGLAELCFFLDAFSDALPLVQEQHEINSKCAGKLENQSQYLQLYFGLVFVHPQSIRLAMVESVALSGNIGNPCWLLSAHLTLTLCPLLALVSTEARLLSSIRGALGH